MHKIACTSWRLKNCFQFLTRRQTDNREGYSFHSKGSVVAKGGEIGNVMLFLFFNYSGSLPWGHSVNMVTSTLIVLI